MQRRKEKQKRIEAETLTQRRQGRKEKQKNIGVCNHQNLE
jgi:hypothetical protein